MRCGSLYRRALLFALCGHRKFLCSNLKSKQQIAQNEVLKLQGVEKCECQCVNKNNIDGEIMTPHKATVPKRLLEKKKTEVM